MEDSSQIFEVKKLLEALENNVISEENVESFIESTLNLTTIDPSSLVYTNLRKYLGVFAFNKGDLLSCAYNFQESLGPALRPYINKLFNHKLNKNGAATVCSEQAFNSIVKKYNTKEWKENKLLEALKDDFVEYYINNNQKADAIGNDFNSLPFVKCISHSTDIESMKKLNEGLPPEWTIVQITKGPCQNDMVGPISRNLSTLPIYITIFSGEHVDIKNHQPITLCVKPNKGSKCILTELLDILHEYEVDKKKSRNELHLNYKTLLLEFEDYFGGIASLLLGKLKSNQDDYKIICKEIDDCIKDFNITQEQKILLYKLAVYIGYSCSFESINNALKVILPKQDDSNARQMLSMHFKSRYHSDEPHYKSIRKAERGPIILIVDQDLDHIPWEVLKCFQLQSVTRVHSLHLLHALYYTYKEQIKEGYFIVDKLKGSYILDPDKNLNFMEMRVKSFINYWLPNWIDGISGRQATTEEFLDLIKSSSIFYYAGHGGGQKFLSHDVLEAHDLSCVALLSGCSSVSIRRLGIAEEYGLHLSYHIAGSPCLVGNLWQVSDKDCDFMMSRLISTWIPGPKSLKHFIQCNTEKWDKGIIDNTKAACLRSNFIGPLHTDILSESDLQKAVSISRGFCKSSLNSCSMVVRGLPTKLIY